MQDSIFEIYISNKPNTQNNIYKDKQGSNERRVRGDQEMEALNRPSGTGTNRAALPTPHPPLHITNDHNQEKSNVLFWKTFPDTVS